MAHKHSVYDSDTHFSINPVTRIIRNESSQKTTLIQYDHNSERFTFEIPRHVEGHDMSICNVVEIHYLNIEASTKVQNAGVYEVADLQICPEDDEFVILSWLISQNATQLVGSLNFLVRFACVTDGVVDYVWNTAIHSGIAISSGIHNDEVIVEQYADVLEQWKQELIEGGRFSVETRSDNTPSGKIEIKETLKIHATNGVGISAVGDTILMGIDGSTFPESLKGGSSLPEVTEAENGKILMVVDGEWEDSRIAIPEFKYIGAGEEPEEPDTPVTPDEPDEPDEPEEPDLTGEYNLITLATEVSTAEEFLAFDGLALLKDYEYNANDTKINEDDKYWVLKVPVQAGDVIRSNTITYHQPTTSAVGHQYIGFYDANGNIIRYTNPELGWPKQQPITLMFDGHPNGNPNYLEIREYGVPAPEGAVYALVNVMRDYRVNNETVYKNGREASIITLNQDANLTAYDGTYPLENYIPVAERSTPVAYSLRTGGEEEYYEAVDDVRIPRYEDKFEAVNESVENINTSLGDIETILADVVGGVE